METFLFFLIVILEVINVYYKINKLLFVLLIFIMLFFHNKRMNISEWVIW